jgi:predicted nucleic acid-binding Zn ribbon protein
MPVAVNVMDGTEQLRATFAAKQKRRTGPDTSRTVRLGEVVGRLVEQRISPRQNVFETVAEAWQRLLPAELGRHCKLDDIAGGQVKVLVDSPVYLHELRLCAPQLTAELQRQCPGARIRAIKFAIG